jgi:hypothetical protein
LTETKQKIANKREKRREFVVFLYFISGDDNSPGASKLYTSPGLRKKMFLFWDIEEDILPISH